MMHPEGDNASEQTASGNAGSVTHAGAPDVAVDAQATASVDGAPISLMLGDAEADADTAADAPSPDSGVLLDTDDSYYAHAFAEDVAEEDSAPFFTAPGDRLDGLIEDGPPAPIARGAEAPIAVRRRLAAGDPLVLPVMPPVRIPDVGDDPDLDTVPAGLVGMPTRSRPQPIPPIPATRHEDRALPPEPTPRRPSRANAPVVQDTDDADDALVSGQFAEIGGYDDDDADDADGEAECVGAGALAYESAATPIARPGVAIAGGGWTIPLLCLGIGLIACCVIIPQADTNRRLAYERERLRMDLESLQQQVLVNDEFLRKVNDDPTLAERLAQRQMKQIRAGTKVLELPRSGPDEPLGEMSPFQLVAVNPPPPLPPYRPLGGRLAMLCYQPHTRLYVMGAGLMMLAAGLVLGYGRT